VIGHGAGKAATYRNVVKAAFKSAGAGNLMVIGVEPRWPETGYGYVEFPRGSKPGAVARVKRFHEKPALAKAKRYLAAGNFYWNSGMFFWRCDALLDQLRQHLPKTATILAALPAFGSRGFHQKLSRAFPLCENISIDFAVLEKSALVHGIPAADFAWNDVGSWNAVYELSTRDECGNAIAAESICLEARNNFVDARGKLVALLGVSDLIVVDTADALLVASRDRAQQVADVVKALERAKREDLL